MLPFTFSSTVISGEKVGRTIGFPTANLNPTPTSDKLRLGVYAGHCQIHQRNKAQTEILKCLAYFGPRYIFNKKQNSFEVYLYDFSANIYDFKINGVLTHFIRPPRDFSQLNDLKKQLEIDKQQGLEIFNAQK